MAAWSIALAAGSHAARDLVPAEDRHQRGLVLPFPSANETLPVLRRLCGMLGLVDNARESETAAEFAKRVRVVATGVEQVTATLSGGNQQKVLLAKWLIPEPRIVILDQPTRGIDVGAKAEIHRIVSHLAAQGIAVILIGDDAVMAMADRIIVFRGGRVAGECRAPRSIAKGDLAAAAHTAQGSRAAWARPPKRTPTSPRRIAKSARPAHARARTGPGLRPPDHQALVTLRARFLQAANPVTWRFRRRLCASSRSGRHWSSSHGRSTSRLARSLP
jgi:ABC-type glutathione transport system ATPase component